jgi:hypothetical protein
MDVIPGIAHMNSITPCLVLSGTWLEPSLDTGMRLRPQATNPETFSHKPSLRPDDQRTETQGK